MHPVPVSRLPASVQANIPNRRNTLIPQFIRHLLHLTFTLMCLSVVTAVAQEVNATGSTASGLPVYTVQSEQSVLRILVGREGLLARMGHNHVIVSRNLRGTIHFNTPPLPSTAQLMIPVDTLIVDDATERQRAGAGYESIPTEKDKQATRSNMLRPEVLDGQHFPEIRIEAVIDGENPDPRQMTITLYFKDQQIGLKLPATLTVNNDQLKVEASFTLEHEQLGLEPFTALGGALRVAKTIGFELQLEARINK